MKISDKGLELIKNFEGCRLTAYKPVAAEVYYTIGYGHYGPDVVKGMTITQEQAEKFLKDDITKFEMIVETVCDYLSLNQNQFDALVSFTFNCGKGNLVKLTANKTRTKKEMMEHILNYNKDATGSVLAGLTRRRKAEKDLFEEPCIDENKEKMDYLGITAWHEAGFKGKGIKIASRENLTAHGKKVYDVLRMIAPEADIVYGKQYTKDIDNNIDIYTTSMFQESDGYETNKKKAKQLYDNGMLLCCAVGNEAEEELQTELSKQPWWTSVGACNLVSGKPLRMFYSSESDSLDFMSFTNMQTPNGLFTGTSCATPVFAAMMALVKQYFLEKGVILSPEELYEFAKNHSVDMETAGVDKRTGWGLFRLPNIDEMEEETQMRYYKIEDIPSWGVDTIKKLVDKGILKGNENGLDLSQDMLRMLVILDRAGVFDKG